MSNENIIDDSNEDAIIVNNDVPTEAQAPVEAEVPVQHSDFKSPILPVDEKESRKYETLTVFGTYTSDEDIVNATQNEVKHIDMDNASEKVLSQFANNGAMLWEAITTFYPNNNYGFALNNPEAGMVQNVLGDKGKKIGINIPKFVAPNSDILVGDNAVRFIKAQAGLGNVTRASMWSSGLVLTIDSFSESRLLDLHNALISQRLDLGTDTRGAAFSGDDVFVVNTVLEFILEHVIESNLINWTIPLLKKLIRPTDINVLLASALVGIYPNGYPIFHHCINVFKRDEESGLPICDYAITSERDPNTGKYKPDSMLDFKRTIWIDDSRLTPADRLHMSANKPTHTEEQILEYQKRVNYVSKHVAGSTLFQNENLKIIAIFKNPSIEEYIKSSRDWCGRVIDMVNKTMTLEVGLTEEERVNRRNSALSDYSTTVDVLKQTHWIDHLVIVDSENVERKMIDAKSIDDTLSAFAVEGDFGEVFNKTVQKFKEDVTISFTGYPNFECPKCHHGQVEPGSRTPTLIPISMVSYFFILMAWRNRAQSVTNRT